jgi:hypothetical protein
MAPGGVAVPREAGRRVAPLRILSVTVMAVLRAAVIAIVLSAIGSAAFAQELSAPEPAKQDQPKAQESTKPVQQAGPTVVEQAASAAMKPVALFSLLEKKSIVFPDIAASTAALSPGQKFELFVDNSISVHAVVAASFGSLIGQAADSPTGFGVGGAAYPKRFGAALARGSSSEFFGTFVIASALHEDPRFFPEHNPTLKESVKYSLRQLFVARNDAGAEVANMPGLLGPLLGEGLANAYWPDRNRTAGDTLFRYGLDLASRAAGNMFREYWPVLSAKIRHEPIDRGVPR